MGRPPPPRSRRAFLGASLALPAPLLLAACGAQPAGGGSSEAAGQARAASDPPTLVAPSPTPPAPAQPAPTQPAPAPPPLQPTPACADGDDATPALTEGPYFKPNSPARTSLLEPGITGTKIVLGGQVLSTNCRPVARALLDFWQADDAGAYDNAGYRLRGHQFTDDQGRYRLETIVPGLYTGRTRHIHVKVQAPNRPVLTTQLFFPGEPRNAGDPIFNPKLLLPVQDTSDGKAATFDFALNLG